MARKLPAQNLDNSTFWQGGAEGTLNMHHCQGCQRYFHPPAPICPRCLSQDVGPRPVSGRGKVLSYTINHQRWNADVEVPLRHTSARRSVGLVSIAMKCEITKGGELPPSTVLCTSQWIWTRWIRHLPLVLLIKSLVACQCGISWIF